MTLIEPLDLESNLVYSFAGNWEIFSVLSLFFIAAMAAKFRMNTSSFGTILALFTVLMLPWMPWMFLLAGVFGGFAIYYTIGKLVTR